MKLAYADPPYLGCCGLYDHFHPDGHCWNDLATHEMLIERLQDEFPDGWALSASSPSLRHILPLTPSDTRVGAWVKTFCAFKRGVRPAYGWEPVMFRGGRNPSNGFSHAPPQKGGKQNTPKDFLACPIQLKKGLTGAKPVIFCEWVMDLLNVQPGDTLIDLYPGTALMGAIAEIRTQTMIPQGWPSR